MCDFHKNTWISFQDRCIQMNKCSRSWSKFAYWRYGF